MTAHPPFESSEAGLPRTDPAPHAHCEQILRGDPFPEVLPAGPSCERCGETVMLTRAPRAGVPPKRFCSPRCQLAAQKVRWKARRRAAIIQEKRLDAKS